MEERGALGQVLCIDFGKYGKYELTPKSLDGSVLFGTAIGEPDNWRKMTLARRFNAAELALFDSEWILEHPGGQFPVEFHADGLNHFVCHKVRLLCVPSPSEGLAGSILDGRAFDPSVINLVSAAADCSNSPVTRLPSFTTLN